MTNNSPQLGAGDVHIVLDGDPKVLKPSVGAALTISRTADGFNRAAQRVLQGDLDVIVQIIGLGLGYSQNGPEMRDLPAKVFRTGISDNSGGLAYACIMFLQSLQNGGRLPVPEEENKEDQSSGPNPPAAT